MATTEYVEESEHNDAIIIDNGSYMLKAGFAGDDDPCKVFPTVVGRPLYGENADGPDDENVYVGNESMWQDGILDMGHPIEQGIVKNWNDMEKLWDHTFYNELHVDPEDHKVLLADSTIITEDREKMAQIMFETFNVPGLYISLQAVLSLYAYGRTTGVVLDSGYGVTNAVPIYEGYAVQHAIQRMEFGGKDITEYLCKILSDRGRAFTSAAEHEIVCSIKESLCYIALDFDQKMHNTREDVSLQKEYELPDGHVITIGNEQFRAPEVLFKPYLLNVDSPGIHESIYNSIMKCFPEPHQRQLLPNIVLSGGTSLCNGINERLKKELSELASPSMIAKVITIPERKYASWIGGSIFASLSATDGLWITKQSYQESGPAVIHSKCL